MPGNVLPSIDMTAGMSGEEIISHGDGINQFGDDRQTFGYSNWVAIAKARAKLLEELLVSWDCSL